MAPLKKIIVPRLELCASILFIKLMQRIQTALRLEEFTGVTLTIRLILSIKMLGDDVNSSKMLETHLWWEDPAFLTSSEYPQREILDNVIQDDLQCELKSEL
ncbi:hypothetical protein NPIL_242131 [Nephila pilipes]|uniref:Uncharacterized protein n=1 Tax=Nephila pilipes TaxID=299642 RepID=A0A8X6U5M8_NEPPI|nr:hypothetical protein NPIL_242131 [Nephila pilipes]